MKYSVLALACAFTPALAQGQASGIDAAAWRQDLATIAEKLPATHPNAFYRMSKSSWDSAVKSIDARLTTMTRNQGIVAFMQLVAMVNDGHTSINPLFDGGMKLHYYPFELFQFDDGLYVKSASPKYASLVGGKVVSIGDMTAGQAMAAINTTVGHENEWFTRYWTPARIPFAEVLQGLGIARDAERVSLVVEKDGTRKTIVVEQAGMFEPSGHNPNAGVPKHGWIDMRGTGEQALWTTRPEMPYWWDFVRADSTMYVAYRGVISMDHPTNQQFWQGVFAAADSLPLKRFVIDLRENPGGNSFYNRQVVRGIVARPKLDQRGKLFVITSGKTFSAAMNLVLDLEAWTNATFVGEPTGNASVFFGDHTQILLPASGLTVNVSTLPWYPDDPRDKRAFVAPRIYTPMTAADYRSNVDPAMRAILSRGTTPPLGAVVERAVLAGDTIGALALVTSSKSRPENRFYSPEAEINTLGYRLIDSNPPAALAVFRINVKAFPNSGNAWDSLAEALVLAGQRSEGIAAYRKALEVAPGLASAEQALARLK